MRAKQSSQPLKYARLRRRHLNRIKPTNANRDLPMSTPHETPVRVRARELPRLLRVDSRCGLEGHEDDGLSVRRADRAHARGQVREEVHRAVRAAPHDEWAGERRREEEVNAPVVRLNVQVEQSAGLDFVL